MNGFAHPIRPMVLLVEDDPVFCRLVADHLDAKGFVVFAAIDGEEALRLMETAPANLFQVLITDIRMPGFDGIELIDRLLRIPAYFDTIIIASMWIDEEKSRVTWIGERMQSLSGKGTRLRLLHKPFGPKDLLKLLEE